MGIIRWIDRNLGRASSIATFVAPIVPGTVGAIVTGALSSGVAWINSWGAFGWWCAALAGGLISTLVYLASGIAYRSFATGRRLNEIRDKIGVNPLEDSFDRKTIRLIDFYDAHYLSHKNKAFRKCTVSGPGLVNFMGGSFAQCEFRHTQIVVVADNQTMWGMTLFENASLVDCQIVNLTMTMNRATYAALDASLKASVPVINGVFP